uniref:Uncharacterized protein n=1 Tax=Arundo donax TaxID=35708 RepID=A0A0A9AXG2_ARUDO
MGWMIRVFPRISDGLPNLAVLDVFLLISALKSI